MLGLLIRHLLDPVSGAIIVLAAALVAEHNGRHVLARGLVAGTALVLALFALLPVGALLARPLEDRYARPAPPAHVDGIVVLSGGLGIGVFATRGVTNDNNSIMRIVAGAALARRYPDARVIFSGTSTTNQAERALEVRSLQRLFADLGLAPDRVIFELRSLDTWENLVYSKQLAKPKAGETWLLVTSAMHLPRAMGIARKLGWNMTAWPSDYDTAARLGAQPLYMPSRGLQTAAFALHEWVGLAVYELEGRLR